MVTRYERRAARAWRKTGRAWRKALAADKRAARAARDASGAPHLMTQQECLPLDVAASDAHSAATGTPARQRIELTDVPWTAHSG